MITTICLMRHGQTDWNSKFLIQGRLNNQLNDTGREQVKNTAKYLKANDNKWDVFLSSPLDRAYESAQIVRDELGLQNLPITRFVGVIEREFGEAEGMHISDEIYAKIVADDVKGLETSKVIQARGLKAILDIAKKYPGKRVFVATHSHFIKGFFSGISKDIHFMSKLGNASLNYIYVEDNKIIDYEFNKKIK